jgi:hypothetical protein
VKPFCSFCRPVPADEYDSSQVGNSAILVIHE